MASRRKGRILAFQALYSWDTLYYQTGNAAPRKAALQGKAALPCKASIPEGLLDFSWEEQKKPIDEETLSFSRLLVTGTVENIIAIDKTIDSHLENWDLCRLNKVDLAVLRMSVYTLMFQKDLHPSIVIDEAIDIAKEFGTDDSYRFVNGVLDSIRKGIKPA